MKTPKIRMLILMLLPLVWAGSAGAAELSNRKIDEEMLKQERIYKSQGDGRPEGYVINRSLSAYGEALTAGFGRELAKLGPKDRWLDIGAGEGLAILDYYRDGAQGGETVRQRRAAKARAVGISIEDRRQLVWYETAANLEKDQIQYLFGKHMRDYSLAEVGKFNIITDLFGGFSYTDEMSLFMDKVLQILEVNGSFYTILQDVQSEAGTNKPYYAGSPFLTEIAKPDGSEVKVCSWLKSISCVDVSCELRTNWKPPVEIYRIRKTCDAPKVPPLTKTKYGAGTPPERTFLLTK